MMATIAAGAGAGAGAMMSDLNTVRTNVTQAPPPPKPWCEQPGNTAHLIEAARYSPFFDGMDEAHNKAYMRIVRNSVKTSGVGSADKTIVKWSPEMKEAARKVTNKRLTQMQSNFRTQYRSKLSLKSEKSSCTVPPFILLGTDTPCLISAKYRDDNSASTDPPEVEAMMELSENPEAYKFYYKNFLKMVIPPVLFKNCLRQDPKSLSSEVDMLARSKTEACHMVEFVTVAEEALGLFVLENYRDVWQEQLERADDNDAGAGVKTPRYTTGKKAALILQKTNGVHVAKGARLSNEGTDRWNELMGKVHADRTRPARKIWEIQVLEEMAAETLNNRKRPREPTTQVPRSTKSLTMFLPGRLESDSDGD
jgi:hypothetical protein